MDGQAGPAALTGWCPMLATVEGDIWKSARTAADCQTDCGILRCGGAGCFWITVMAKALLAILSAVRHHHYSDGLKAGIADLSAHVDFEALLDAAASGGAALRHGDTRTVPLRPGIQARLEALVKTASQTQAVALRVVCVA